MPYSASHTRRREVIFSLCPQGFRCLAVTFPKSISPGRPAGLTRPPFPASLLNPYCCLEEKVGLRDSREQSRRGHDLAIITLPWGREGSSLGFQSPFGSVLYVLYIKHLSEKKTRSSGKKTRSHIFSSWTSALITGNTGWQHEGGAYTSSSRGHVREKIINSLEEAK